jgi:Carboxypeptidase regulatory-like domain
MLSGRSGVTAHRLRNLALLFLLVVLISGAFSTTTSLAQDDAAIHGALSDATGSAIAGGTVKIKNLETGSLRTLITDDSGRFEAPALAVGAYEVSAEKAGFQPARAKVNLVLGQRATVDLQLAVAELQQNVQVQETAISADVSTTETSGLVGERQVKDLPLNGRSYDQLVTLNPGVVNYTSQRAGGIGTSNSVVGNMFSASGRRPQENLYLLNGVEYTGASEINNTPGGASGQLLGVDAVREFSVVKDDYGAEYGKRPGAQINIVTASGSNGVHGSAYEFLRNSALDARNFFDHGDIPQFQRDVFGASLGGPIKKDKAFLFANYEGFRQNLGLSDVTLVPDTASRTSAVAGIRPLLALWPVANGPELPTSTGAPSGIAEAFTNPVQHVREDFGTARFDETFSSKDSFAAVYTADDSTADSPSNNPFTVDDIFLREQVASLAETHIFSPSVLNRATFGFSRGGFYFNSGTTVDLPSWVNAGQPVGAVVVGGGTTLNGASQISNGGTNAGSNLRAARNLFTAEDHLTLTHGNHLFDLGVWFQRLQSNDSLVQDQYGQISFASLKTFIQQGIVSTYTYAPSYTPLGWRSSEGAFYAEDAVKLKPSLELRIGFRGEFTNGWNEVHGRASNYLYNSAGVILSPPAVGTTALAVNNAKFLPAPRLSLAWAPFASKKTVIRAGVGVYYALLDNLSYRLDQNPPYNTVSAVKNIPFSSIAPDKTYAGAKVIPSGVQPNLQTPTVESYTLKIEQQIAPNTVLSVGYIGSHGYHELLSLDTNLPVPTICPASPCPSGYPAGASYFPANAPLANNSVWNTTDWFSEGVSSYNGLEVDINHRIARGLQFRGAYTFAKALDDGDNMNTSVATNSPAFVADPLQPKADYGRASFDIRNSAVINATYDLPFGRSALRTRAWLDRLIEGWQVSGIETIQSGLPFTPQLSYNPSNDGDTRNPVRPSWNPAFTGPLLRGLPGEYFNPNAFVQPLPGTYGNVGRNVLHGPSLVELDLSLAKRFALSERFNLQFRAESFNLLNRANLNAPNPVVFTAATGGASPTAGVVTNTSTTSRQLQFGLKLLW